MSRRRGTLFPAFNTSLHRKTTATNLPNLSPTSTGPLPKKPRIAVATPIPSTSNVSIFSSSSGSRPSASHRRNLIASNRFGLQSNSLRSPFASTTSSICSNLSTAGGATMLRCRRARTPEASALLSDSSTPEATPARPRRVSISSDDSSPMKRSTGFASMEFQESPERNKSGTVCPNISDLLESPQSSLAASTQQSICVSDSAAIDSASDVGTPTRVEDIVEMDEEEERSEKERESFFRDGSLNLLAVSQALEGVDCEAAGITVKKLRQMDDKSIHELVQVTKVAQSQVPCLEFDEEDAYCEAMTPQKEADAHSDDAIGNSARSPLVFGMDIVSQDTPLFFASQDEEERNEEPEDAEHEATQAQLSFLAASDLEDEDGQLDDSDVEKRISRYVFPEETCPEWEELRNKLEPTNAPTTTARIRESCVRDGLRHLLLEDGTEVVTAYSFLPPEKKEITIRHGYRLCVNGKQVLYGAQIVD